MSHEERVAKRIREAPDGPLNVAYRRWIVRHHLRHGGMPPLDLRPDWRNVPEWSR
jgi:hypothetical protein